MNGVKKSARMEEFIAGLAVEGTPELHECYLGYFTCFNAEQYYEAHDVLEHLWLQGRTDNYAFFKGLIQLAGAYVHLRKQHLRPEHPTDGARLRPAVRLFKLALENLARYQPIHLRLDVTAICRHCEERITEIEDGGYTANPWQPGNGPRMELLDASVRVTP